MLPRERPAFLRKQALQKPKFNLRVELDLALPSSQHGACHLARQVEEVRHISHPAIAPARCCKLGAHLRLGLCWIAGPIVLG